VGYTLSGSTLSLTAAGFAKFDSLAQGTPDTAVFGYDVTHRSPICRRTSSIS
jgi:hypothetical protein